MKTVKRYLPGCALALVIAAIAKLLDNEKNLKNLLQNHPGYAMIHKLIQ